MNQKLQLQSTDETVSDNSSRILHKEIQVLKDELKQLKSRKRFGLVWEDKPEQVVELCKEQFPVLKETEELEIWKGSEEPTHIIIEGDNYHALSVLNYTHAGEIDAIYADPPYNTGAKNWVYNNDYVDGNDSFRHSKWLSFMDKRLRLAKSLLKEEGIIVVTIDDYEVATLTLLMNEIFGEDNHLGTVVIKSNPSGRSTTSGFSVSHEYALFYAKSSLAKIGRLQRDDKQIARYKETDDLGNFEWVNFRKHGGTRGESPKMYYPIYINYSKSNIRIPDVVWENAKKAWRALDDPTPDEVISYPIDDFGKDRRWKWSIERARAETSEMKVALDRKKNPAVYIKSRMKDEGMLPLTWWDKTEYSATAYGTNLLKKILPEGTHFDYPKSLYAVMDTICVLTNNKSAKILDFFAGSGTTGHAVSLLNKEDGGNRQFILCTNNENGIAQEVCYPRIKSVIEGDDDEGLLGISSNLKYFKTDFIDSEPTDRNKKNLIDKSTEMLCLKEDCFEEIKKANSFKIFKNNQDKYLGIIYDDEGIEGFKQELAKLDKKIITYVFSLDESAREEEFEGMTNIVELKPIPVAILNVYKRIFK